MKWLGLSLAAGAAAVLACNSILGNEGGVYVPPIEGGSSSSSSSGSTSSGSSGASSSSGSTSSSGGPVDGGTCACSAGCDLEPFPRLCALEDLPDGLPASVTTMAATEAALYLHSDELAGLLRYDLSGGDFNTFDVPRGPLATMYTPTGNGDDVFFVLAAAGDAYTVKGFDNAGQELTVPGVQGASPTQIISAYERVAVFAPAANDGSSHFVFHLKVPEPVLEQYPVAGIIQHVAMAANARGVWFVPVPTGQGSQGLGLVHPSRGTELFSLPNNAGPPQLLAAGDDAVYLTGGCPGAAVAICKAAAPGDTGVELVATLHASVPIPVLHASGAVLYFTESSSLGSLTYRCDAEHCDDSKQELGAAAIQAFARTTTHDYIALQGGRIHRIERRP